MCSRVTPRAGREGERPQLKCRPRKDKLPLHRDDGGASALQPENRLASVARRRWGIRVLALATGKTQQEIAAACKGARPNHVGVVLARHKRAGRIEERDGKLYATQSAGTTQPGAV